MTRANISADITIRETKRDYTYDGTVVLSLTIRRPVVSLPNNRQAQARINSRYSAEAAEFMRNASTTLYRQAVELYLDSQASDLPFRQFEAFMQYEITFNASCYLSSYYDAYQFTGGAHGNTVRASDTFDLKTGRRLPLSYYFRPGFNYKGFLLGQIIKQADKNMEQEPIYFEDYRELIVKNFNPKSYFLSPEGLNIYYQQYDIAPYSSGIVVFTIPYATIGWQPKC